MAFHYVHEKAMNAAHALAAHGDLAERIHSAYLSGLLSMENEFDVDSRKLEDEWREVMGTVRAEDGSIADHLARLDEMEQGTAAEAIVDLCRHIEQEWGRRAAAGTEFD